MLFWQDKAFSLILDRHPACLRGYASQLSHPWHALAAEAARILYPAKFMQIK
jgi:hypothetical protein